LNTSVRGKIISSRRRREIGTPFGTKSWLAQEGMVVTGWEVSIDLGIYLWTNVDTPILRERKN
jgi:hypothetical protein